MVIRLCGIEGTFLLTLFILCHCPSQHYHRSYDPDYPPEWQDAQPWLTQRKWATNNPIFQPDNVSVACNWPGDPAPSSIPIQAGQNFSGVYYYWQHTYGPMLIWMADCGGDCTTFDATKGKWFKLREDGLMSGTIRDGAWFQQLWADHWDGEPDYYGITIPVNIKPGNYLIRHEIIAIHSENKPQFYPECVHVKVSGDGTAVPGEEYYTSIPGVWSMDRESRPSRFEIEFSVKLRDVMLTSYRA